MTGVRKQQSRAQGLGVIMIAEHDVFFISQVRLYMATVSSILAVMEAPMHKTHTRISRVLHSLKAVA